MSGASLEQLQLGLLQVRAEGRLVIEDRPDLRLQQSLPHGLRETLGSIQRVALERGTSSVSIGHWHVMVFIVDA
jgi:hypothetical protein